MEEIREFTKEQINNMTSVSLTQGVIVYNKDIKDSIESIMNDSGLDFVTKDLLFEILDKKRDEYISNHIANNSGEFDEMLELPTNSHIAQINIIPNMTSDTSTSEHHCHCGGNSYEHSCDCYHNSEHSCSCNHSRSEDENIIVENSNCCYDDGHIHSETSCD